MECRTVFLMVITFFFSLIPGIKKQYCLKLLTIGYETMVGFANGEETNRKEAILNRFFTNKILTIRLTGYERLR